MMHIVSHVEGNVRREISALDVLRACLPAGTLSGAPKVRAMELINQFEPVRRGYTVELSVILVGRVIWILLSQSGQLS